jgi:2-oxoglutarate dehydrogenase E2 component (dihydrolipoamide succinyltransferase)
MASAMRVKAATGLLGLSRAIPKIQPTHVVALSHSARLCHGIDPQRRLFSSSAALNGEIIVKVPQMAESISEGTLASLPKKVGEQIEADEEIASIETDKIDVAVNAPEAAVIAEYFAAEGDTVVVGQDLARIVTGDDAGSVKKTEEEAPPAKEETKDTKEETKAAESEPKPEEKTPAPEPPKAEKTSAPAPKPAPKQAEPAPVASSSGPSRGERTVSQYQKLHHSSLTQSTGKDDAHAKDHCWPPQAIPRHLRIPHHNPRSRHDQPDCLAHKVSRRSG